MKTWEKTKNPCLFLQGVVFVLSSVMVHGTLHACFIKTDRRLFVRPKAHESKVFMSDYITFGKLLLNDVKALIRIISDTNAS